MECSRVQSLLHHLTLPSKSPKPDSPILPRKPLFPNNLNLSLSVINSHTTTISQSLLRRASSEGLALEGENAPEDIISGEWPENFSLLNYDDLRAYLEPEIFKDKMHPSALLGEVMSAVIRTASVDQTVEEIDHHFEFVSGLPVVDEKLACIGVVSKKDKQRAPNGSKSKVKDIMSSPAVVLTPDKTVLDAAILMLKEKFHRIPIVNEDGQIV
ncbi:hypothetical protein Syun_006442 [Stephania yunnanensis]|uniref:CBS domain-containing protein n=1 Tax=Stephania yunnanensis TaxID=152371 RepID=A0AAP0KWP9_9MAGN